MGCCKSKANVLYVESSRPVKVIQQDLASKKQPKPTKNMKLGVDARNSCIGEKRLRVRDKRDCGSELTRTVSSNSAGGV